MTTSHLSEDLLLRHSDGEVTSGELLELEKHITVCEQCRERVREFSRLSEDLESAIADVPVEFSTAGRDLLQQVIESQQTPSVSRGRSSGWTWSLALAASLAFAMLLFLPGLRHKQGVNDPTRVRAAALEIEGESFIPLPYSNPDLPISSSRIVQMQVPVSSLAEAGVVFGPISNTAAAADRSVLADVLLGLDGQPLGVHVLEIE
jgi:hypothetical protein